MISADCFGQIDPTQLPLLGFPIYSKLTSSEMAI